MAYVRKTEDRFQLRAAHLRRRAALVKAGMKERELLSLVLHDVHGLTFATIGVKLNVSGARAQQIFQSGYRKIFSPGRREIAFPKSSPRTK